MKSFHFPNTYMYLTRSSKFYEIYEILQMHHPDPQPTRKILKETTALSSACKHQTCQGEHEEKVGNAGHNKDNPGA